jgi:hypothetical protein
MTELGQSPVYNSRNRKMPLSSRVRCRWCALLLLSQLAVATDWQQPTAQLASRIAAATGPGVIALEVANRSSIPAAETEQIRRGLTAKLADSGIRVWQPDQAAALVKITLSENLESYVWVAEIHQGAGQSSIVIVSTDRDQSLAATEKAPLLALRATPLISRPEAILDVAVLDGSPRRALALSSSAVTIYVFQDNRWLPGQSLPISHPTPFPRDLRGRIILRVDHLFDTFLPGIACHSTESASGSLNMRCLASDDPWPIETADSGLSGFFAPARNFFTGAIVPGIGKQRSAPPFYSAAAIPKDNYVLWLFSGVDGQLHLLDGINQQTVGKLRWGSDIAGVRSSCRPGWQVLASSPANDVEDSLQAFEFPDREPVAVSQKLPISGRVTALWTEQNGEAATAVYRSSETGDYEAVQLTLACGQ